MYINVIYIYIYIYHIEGAVFTTIWCSMYKVQSVDIYIYICIYIYIYIYHMEGAVFTTIWCSMYKEKSVDSRNAEKEKTDSLLL